MDIATLTAWLTEGLAPEDAAKVKASIERDAIKAKVGGLKQESEYQDLQTRMTQTQQELEGDAATGKLGARAYAKWYTENYPKVEKLMADKAAYEAKFGALDGTPPPKAPPTDGGGRIPTEAEISAMVDKRIQEGYAPRWSELLTSTGGIVQKHMLAGRKTPIDFAKVSELANKYGGDLNLAYDQWDQPERDRLAKEATDKEVQRRVDEELAKRGTQQHFPGAADMSVSSLSLRTKADIDKFDKGSMMQDLARGWNNPEPVQ